MARIEKEQMPMDIVFIALSLALFVLTAALVVGAEKLRKQP